MEIVSISGCAGIIELLVIIALAIIAWVFRARAIDMERYVEANRATREFVTVVMKSLEDLSISDSEADEIREKCVEMLATISTLIASLEDGQDPAEVLDESISRMKA